MLRLLLVLISESEKCSSTFKTLKYNVLNNQTVDLIDFSELTILEGSHRFQTILAD